MNEAEACFILAARNYNDKTAADGIFFHFQFFFIFPVYSPMSAQFLVITNDAALQFISFRFNSYFYFHNCAAVEHTILRSWAVKDFAPNVPQYVQIFRWVKNSRRSQWCMCASTDVISFDDRQHFERIKFMTCTLFAWNRSFYVFKTMTIEWMRMKIEHIGYWQYEIRFGTPYEP